MQGYDGETLSIGDIESFLNKPRHNSNKIQGIWNKIDDKILKPIFIDNFNTAREEHSQIAKEIMKLFENHEKKKLKDKAINSFNKKNRINDPEDLNGIEMKDQEDLNLNLNEIENSTPSSKST